VNVNQVGSTVSLLFRSKYPTFTPDHFNKAFKDKGYTATQGQAIVSNNPNAKPIPTVYYSKENLVVMFNPVENLLVFQIINTLNINDIYEKDIKPILISLNFVEDSVSMRGLECITQISDNGNTMDTLTKLINQNFVGSIKKTLGLDHLISNSIKLSTSYPFTSEGTQLTIEPLANDPEHSYFFQILFRTEEMSKFNDMVDKFGENLIKEIIEQVMTNAK